MRVVWIFSCLWLCASGQLEDALAPRIIGGSIGIKGQLPYIVSVRDRRTLANSNHICGGIIVGWQDIVTAAQCVSDVTLPNLYVVAGSLKLNFESVGGIGIEAGRVEIHPFYKRLKHDYDIAIIRLARRLPETRADIKPAYLLRDLPKSGTTCLVSGWGDVNGTSFTPTILPDVRVAQVSYVPTSECKRKYDYIPNDAVCSSPASSKSAGGCIMDAGGPLYCENGVLGIYSWSEGCGTNIHPGVYSSIPYHHYWIAENTDLAPTTVKPGTTAKGTTKKAGSTVKGTTKKAGSTVKGTTKKAGSTVKGTTKKAGSTVKGTTKKAGSTVKGTTKKAGSTVKATTRKPGGNSSFRSSASLLVIITGLIVIIYS